MSDPSSLGALARLFLRLGFSGLGGPLVHIAMMEAEVVERRRWLTREQFLSRLALCQTLPGPASTQLGVLISYLVGGLRGALLGGVAFVLPGFLIMLALTLAYDRYGALPALRGVFVGIAPVVVAIIGFSAWRLARTACSRWDLVPVAAAGFGLTLAGVDTVLTLLVLGALWAAYGRLADRLVMGALGFPLIMAGGPDVYARILWLWVKMGALVYGGGYVIIPVVRGEAVERFGWLTDGVFLDGLALVQVTPGPIVNLSVFVGYQAGGVLGSVLAAAGVFVPAFAIVLGAAPLMRRLEEIRALRSFLQGVNSAVVGAIVGATLPLARGALGSPFSAVIAVLAATALWRYRVDTVWLVLGGGTVGWLWSLVA